MNKIIKNTIDSGCNELQIIGTTYSANNEIDGEFEAFKI